MEKKIRVKPSEQRIEVLNNIRRVNSELDYNLALLKYYSALDSVMEEYDLYKGYKSVYNENCGNNIEADENMKKSMQLTLETCLGHIKALKKAETEVVETEKKKKLYELKKM